MTPRFVLPLLLVFSLSLSLAVSAAPAADVVNPYAPWGFYLAGMDGSVKPGDDFFQYAEGKWAATTPIPADKPRYTTFDEMRDRSEGRVRGIVDGWAADGKLKSGSSEAKVAALYRSFLDEAAIEKAGLRPLEPHLDAIRKASTREELARLMGRSFGGFGRSFFVAGVFNDERDPNRYALHMMQAGLGLRDRDFYLRENFRPQKERYQQYVAAMLRLAGWPEADARAAEIVAMETKIAEAHWSRAESRDRDRTYNSMTFAELAAAAPDFPWSAFFRGAGVEKAGRVIVAQNTAFPKIARVFAEAPLTTLQAWSAFHLVDSSAPVLPKRFADAAFEFRGKFLNGIRERRPRWKEALEEVESAMGEAVGREYAARYFPPESKKKMEQLVGDLLTAMKGRIERVDWMSPATKERALEKLAKFHVKVGYPSRWRDYSGLDIREGDLAGNDERVAKFEWARQVSRIGQAVDREEWGLTPQTVNAYYDAGNNEIVFPAALLQPPFFDPHNDAAMNYGAIGGGIGHEITHAFDDQGRKSDGTGALRDWWTAEDAAKFEARAAKLGAQYEALELAQAPGARINAKLTMGENIADLGAVLLALDAYHLSLHGQPAPVLDGFTGDQRLFLAWAQKWRARYRDDALRQSLVGDTHSPGFVRGSAPLRNIDAWYEAFGVKEGDKSYLPPEERVRIW